MSSFYAGHCEPTREVFDRVAPMNEENPPPGEDQPGEGQSSESSAEAPQSPEPDPVEQFPQVGEMVNEMTEIVAPPEGPNTYANPVIQDVDQALGADPEIEAVQAGCGVPGCAVAILVLIVAVSVLAFLFGDALFGSDASSQEAVQPDVGGTSPLLAYENVYDADGNLIPLPGEWHVYNEAGVDTCTFDISVDPSVQSMKLAVLDGGEQIRIQEIVEGELVGPTFDLDRISSSATEATYREDLSGVIGRDQAIEATFSSSSTWGGKVEGCPDRGARGSFAGPGE
jgi:hypothetical protein